MRGLLDVSVLIALFDRAHVDHLRAKRWLAREVAHGWASCAITQLGFARIMSQPGYPKSISPARALELLDSATRDASHEFWPCATWPADARQIDPSRVHGPNQLTDVYLLALAVAQGGRLVTLDQKIPISAVVGASPSHLVVI